jgi:hypothetical protein
MPALTGRLLLGLIPGPLGLIFWSTMGAMTGAAATAHDAGSCGSLGWTAWQYACRRHPPEAAQPQPVLYKAGAPT